MSALVANRHTPVDATSGAVAMTLPTGAAQGDEISVEKYDATANAVTVTGNIRAVAAQTITLALVKETVGFRADAAGSWWPIYGHKTLSSTDKRYPQLSRWVVEFDDDLTQHAVGALSGVAASGVGTWGTMTGGTVPSIVLGPDGVTRLLSSAASGYAPFQISGGAVAGRIIEEQVILTSATAAGYTIALSPDTPFSLTNLLHIQVDANSAVVTVKAGAAFDPLSYGTVRWRHPENLPVDGVTPFLFRIGVFGNTLVVYDPTDGMVASNGTFTDVNISKLALAAGTWVFTEPGDSGTGKSYIRHITSRGFKSLSAASAEPAFGSFLDAALLGQLTGGGGGVAGSRDDHAEVRVGYDPELSLPSVGLGPYTVVTSLAAAATTGGSSISTLRALPNGSVIQIESGTNSESVTGNANPSPLPGAGGPPFTQAISTTLTKTHPKGSRVVAAVPSTGRARIWLDSFGGTGLNLDQFVANGFIYFAGRTARFYQPSPGLIATVGTGAALGTLRVAPTATGSFPTAGTMTNGGMLYDTTKHQPMWSDNLIIRDALGYSTTLLTKTANFTLLESDKIVAFNGTSLTATLLDPTVALVGKVYTVKNVNASALTVASAGTSKTIDGAASASLAQWAAGRYVSDGTQWLSV